MSDIINSIFSRVSWNRLRERDDSKPIRDSKGSLISDTSKVTVEVSYNTPWAMIKKKRVITRMTIDSAPLVPA